MAEWKPTSPGVEGLDVDDVATFMEVLNGLDEKWEWDASVRRFRWIFRGQSDSSWPLVPSAWRTPAPPALEAARRRVNELVPNDVPIRQLDRTGALPFPPNFDAGTGRAVTVQANAELALISEFVHRADELGFHVPGPMPPEFQRGLIFEVNRPIAADDFIDVQFSDQQAGLAQHYGVPTRLLDWTDDPLIAAFFASTGPSHGARIAVWALNESHVAPGMAALWEGVAWGLRVVRPPRAPNAFLLAQRGTFTVAYGAGLFALVNGGRFPSLEELARSHPDRPLLRRLTLPGRLSAELADHLARHHVSQSDLMPSLQSAAMAVVDRWMHAGENPSRLAASADSSASTANPQAADQVSTRPEY